MMRCKHCGFTTSWKRLRCPICGSSMEESYPQKGKIVTSWKLNVTPEGLDEAYYINLIKVDNGKIMCKSKKYLSEGTEVILEGEECKESEH